MSHFCNWPRLSENSVKLHSRVNARWMALVFKGIRIRQADTRHTVTSVTSDDNVQCVAFV